MGWNGSSSTTGSGINSFIYCTHCRCYSPAPHECLNDPMKEVVLRLQRVENYLLELLSKARSTPLTLPSDSSS